MKVLKGTEGVGIKIKLGEVEPLEWMSMFTQERKVPGRRWGVWTQYPPVQHILKAVRLNTHFAGLFAQ